MFTASGCGNGLASVSGVVMLDGRQVGGADKYGTVTFVRESGGAPVVGIIDESGHYTLKTGTQDGVEPGMYLVSIAVRKITPSAQQYGLAQATAITPARYASAAQSGLKNEVKPGRNTIDFNLSSKLAK
jgi:hypothetical protein